MKFFAAAFVSLLNVVCAETTQITAHEQGRLGRVLLVRFYVQLCCIDERLQILGAAMGRGGAVSARETFVLQYYAPQEMQELSCSVR